MVCGALTVVLEEPALVYVESYSELVLGAVTAGARYVHSTHCAFLPHAINSPGSLYFPPQLLHLLAFSVFPCSCIGCRYVSQQHACKHGKTWQLRFVCYTCCFGNLCEVFFSVLSLTKLFSVSILSCQSLSRWWSRSAQPVCHMT